MPLFTYSALGPSGMITGELTASDRGGEVVRVDAAMVKARVAPLAGSADLSRFIL